jgi:drug/metabolite transporter (DMT)-like permease
MISSSHLLGSSLALLSACLWAAASLIWDQLNKQRVLPIVMSLGKAVLAFFCFILTAVFITYHPPDGKTHFMLALSGILGIGVGDTAFFYSLKYLGPRRSVLLTVGIPILTSLLAFLFLRERLSLFQWIGIVACIGGIIIVIQECVPYYAYAANKGVGVFWGIISIVACAVSILISKTALSMAGAFEASLIRLQAGAIGLFAYCLISRQCFKAMRCLINPATLKILFVGAFFGTFLGIWCSINALKYTSASIATVLNGTSPIFILPLSYWFLKEKISRRAVLGTVLAASGAACTLIR